jgi:Bacteriophage lambda head decoration protein D
MDLTVKTTSYLNDSKAWLGSAHAVDTAESVTLDAATILAVFTDGEVPSGVVLGKITASGKYGPYSNGAADGRQTATGHLLNRVKVTSGQNAAGAMIWHGQVVEAKLPTNHGLDAAAKAELPHIHYV